MKRPTKTAKVAPAKKAEAKPETNGKHILDDVMSGKTPKTADNAPELTAARVEEAMTNAAPRAKKADNEPRPMPKDFKPKFELEGSRMVARKDGVEVAYSQTDDKKAGEEAETGAAQHMWDGLEQQRIRALEAKAE